MKKVDTKCKSTRVVWMNGLNEVLKRAGNGGIREGVQYLRGRIYSTISYCVLRHAMDMIPDVSVSLHNFEFREVTSINSPYIEELYRVYPPEFGPSDPEYVSRVLQQYFDSGAWCFILCHEERLVGAFWLSQPNHWYASLNIPYLLNEYVVQNLFIVPIYRGCRASEFLLVNGLEIARQRGVSSVLAIIKATNSASLRTHLRLNFDVIGSFIKEWRWFHCHQMFSSATER